MRIATGTASRLRPDLSSPPSTRWSASASSSSNRCGGPRWSTPAAAGQDPRAQSAAAQGLRALAPAATVRLRSCSHGSVAPGMDRSLVPMSRKLPSSSDTAGSNLQHACRAVVLLKPSAFDGDCVHAAYVASLDQKSPYPTAVNTGVVRDSSQPLSRGKGQGFAHRGFIRTQAAPRTRLSALGYRIYLPSGSSRRDSLPLIVMLHGCQQNSLSFA